MKDDGRKPVIMSMVTWFIIAIFVGAILHEWTRNHGNGRR